MKSFSFNAYFTIGIFIGLAGLSGCASLGTYNPATGRSEFIAISTMQEISMGNDIHKSIAKQYKFSEDQQVLERVKKLGLSIAKVSDRQDYVYKFFVVENDELNAFTTPGGNIYIFSGLIDKLESDDALASVLAHEIGHCAAKHTVKKFQAVLGYQLLGSIIFSQIEGGASSIARMSTNTIMNLVFSSYSRHDEYEADRLGVKYMYKSGYDLEGVMSAFNTLIEEAKGGATPSLFRTHPHLSDRMRAVKHEIASAERKYRQQ